MLLLTKVLQLSKYKLVFTAHFTDRCQRGICAPSRYKNKICFMFIWFFFFLLLEQLISVHVQVEENAGALGDVNVYFSCITAW